MKPIIRHNTITCMYCDARLTPAQFTKHWHEDYTYND